MAEYSWTFHIGRLRVGWLKHCCDWIYNKEKGLYLQIGKLDFYIPSK